MRTTLALLVVCAGTGAAAQAPQQVEVDVLARPVARGAILSTEDFARHMVAAPMARAALRAADAVGQAATRNLLSGATVGSHDIAPPPLVRRGGAVALTLRSGALVISAPARALSDGAAGASVRIVNLATNRTLDAFGEGSGRGAVLLP